MPRCRPVDRDEDAAVAMAVAETVGGAGAGAVNILKSPAGGADGTQRPEAATGGYVNARVSATFDRQPSRRVYTTVSAGVWSNALEAEGEQTRW